MKNTFFILKAKCSMIAEHLGCDIGQMVLRRGDAFIAGDLAEGGEVHAWV